VEKGGGSTPSEPRDGWPDDSIKNGAGRGTVNINVPKPLRKKGRDFRGDHGMVASDKSRGWGYFHPQITASAVTRGTLLDRFSVHKPHSLQHRRGEKT